MGTLEGKVALITGAGTGIGRGIAELFAAEGAKVVIAARREGPLKDVAATNPARISHVRMDLRSRDDREAAFKAVIERHGQLDILVNNAGSQYHGPFVDMSDEDIDDVVLTNMAATMQMTRSAIPLLAKTRGNIVNISSTAGRFVAIPSMVMIAYGSTKAGINHFTRTVAADLGPMGIRINAVAPGLTYGEVSNALLFSQPDAPLDALKGVTPLGRFGEPIDIARVVLFMASEQASWVTGQVIDASGGWQLSC